MTNEEITTKYATQIARLREKGSKISDQAMVEIFAREERNVAKNAKKHAKGFERRANVSETSTPLWGPGCKYSTQQEYQRACLGGKWNSQYYN